MKQNDENIKRMLNLLLDYIDDGNYDYASDAELEDAIEGLEHYSEDGKLPEDEWDGQYQDVHRWLNCEDSWLGNL